MPCVTDCSECGAPDAILIMEYRAEQATWHVDELYLCRECADRREGIPPMDEQTSEGDGQGRR